MKNTNNNSAPKSYEAAIAEAQKLVQALEDPATTLEELGTYTQRISFLLQYCRQRLQEVAENSQKK
jgi:exodeoxyribonuclease VII small subunit